ncbi:MAG: ABC transporter permease [Christensenellaceae bacterium]|nr:ABC transporter permease [Christensenellaceae bacterium]
MKIFKELYDYRQMIFGLVKKDLRGRYKGSVLGFLWTFINPLLQLLVYTLVFSVILGSNIEKYYLYLFVALIPWIFFSSSIAGGSSCVLNQKGMVTKIYFPREVLPISHVTTCFMNMVYSMVVVIAVSIISGTPFSIIGYLCLPIIMIVEYFLALGIAMIVSSLTVFFRDLEYIVGILMMVWQFLTPIMYSIDMVPAWLHGVFNLNPMTPIVTAYRAVLYEGTIPRLETLLAAVGMGVVFFVLGFLIFGKLKKRFAEEL